MHVTAGITHEKTIVGVDSNYDPATSTAFQYRQTNVYDYFRFKGFGVTLLNGATNSRSHVSAALAQDRVEYITGVGHGYNDTFTGDYGFIIFQVGQYDASEPKDKIVHFLSCLTANWLGLDFVAKGCKAFFGYDVNFTFPIDLADKFLECDSEIDRSFADGLNAEDTYKRVRALFDQRISEMDGSYYASVLANNRDHLRCPSSGGSPWGDPSAKL